ncbi:MAG TPA: histidine kinase [Vicinamibacterales bacterium]|nr:histidine kinase [Vicinamibacterales bacterium]
MTPAPLQPLDELFPGPRRLALLAAAIAVPAVIIATQLYVGYRLRGVPIAFGGVLLTQLCHWELWVVAGPIVWGLERRWPLSQPGRWRSLRRHLAASVVVATAVLAGYLAVYHVMVRLPFLSAWFVGFERSFFSMALFVFVTDFHIELLLYGSIVAVAHAVRTTALLRTREHDALRLEAELTGAKLKVLRTQLQPHFLFNTLHTIGSLVLQRQNERAVQLLAELGELLRGTLAMGDTELAPLRDEITYLKRYLRIEEARFGDRLTVEWGVDPAVEEALIPPFILQPLVENAFRHGISHCPDASILRITAEAPDGRIRIAIYNDGPQLSESFSSENSRGYGLKNVRDRLRTRNPPGDIDLVNLGQGVCATLVIPRWTVPRAIP